MGCREDAQDGRAGAPAPDAVPHRRFGALRRLVPRAFHPWARALRKLLFDTRPRDEPFRTVFTYTLVHLERQRHLHALARRVVDEGIPGALVECGVADGGSAALLGHATAGASPVRELHLFDSWQGLPPATSRDGRGAGAWSGDVVGSPRRVRRVLGRLGVATERVHFHPGWFEQTFATAQVESVALLHLDADFHDPTELALAHWWPRLSPGAWVQVDDYDALPGCRAAVDAFLAEHAGVELETLRGRVNVRFFRKPPGAASGRS